MQSKRITTDFKTAWVPWGMEAQVKGVVKMMDYQVTNIQRAYRYKDVFTLTSLALKFLLKKSRLGIVDLGPVLPTGWPARGGWS